MQRGIATLFLLVLPIILKAAEPKPGPVAAKTITLKAQDRSLTDLLNAVTAQTGLKIDRPSSIADRKATVSFDRVPVWAALEDIALQTGQRVILDRGQFKLVAWPTSTPRPPSSVDGPFRVVVRKLVTKRDFDADTSECAVHLDVQWEPRFPVFLIDSEPTLSSATAAGTNLNCEKPNGKLLPRGFNQEVTVKLTGLPNTANQIDELAGSFRVVVAEQMLAVSFDDLTSDKPITETEQGVQVTFHPVRRLERRTEFSFDLVYPDSHPTFESFQQWATANRLTLISPDGKTRIASDPENASVDSNGQRVRGVYHFPSVGKQAVDLKSLTGWKAVYETPSPLAEQVVPFRFRNLPRW